MTITLYVTFCFAGAAFFGLIGTNAQAQLARKHLMEDSDILVATAGSYWRPVRWLVRKPTKSKRDELEAVLRKKPKRWRRYQILCRELFAWNAIETSVAIAFVASVVACIQLVYSIVT